MKIYDEADESRPVCLCVDNDEFDPGAWETIPFWSALLEAFSDSDANEAPKSATPAIRKDRRGKRLPDASVVKPGILATAAPFGYPPRFPAWFSRRKHL